MCTDTCVVKAPKKAKKAASCGIKLSKITEALTLIEERRSLVNELEYFKKASRTMKYQMYKKSGSGTIYLTAASLIKIFENLIKDIDTGLIKLGIEID
jgi:hypothetical protein